MVSMRADSAVFNSFFPCLATSVQEITIYQLNVFTIDDLR